MKREDEMLTAAQAAKEKGCSRQAVTQAIKDGRLTAEKWGRFYVIRRRDVERWTLTGRVGPEKAA